ncbi:trans-aconitate methyltransferase [Salipiger aestuarii]|uniref:Trans-aconitate 2-methyltransferase n=1 Tax=Salipiger aestuarii TaxID=568098 RepID=A0A327XVQ6_9RHOB|nr:methyltransferase domain-containing protein [Salipiger aestuarii]EIE50611.1 trans-aconitate 2-methyltransferase [Citreicella sp. 357]KAA8606280.1 trans-aconitate methyltransferase [Salipiger aestuarii]KAA8609363.1 trans-aconitate methyltransferase [Salipiger aestuarii]KAB2540933.1 trans-aconitate methyltransferase [Salipiger aestuarii]RAK12773.1 trans-aconitate 2-methyltransferase [Salipiger aestuarii]
MSSDDTRDWDPGLYHKFRGLRLRPAMDLLRAVGPLPEGGVVDLGCGSGAAAPALKALKRSLTGVDLSASMLEKARVIGCYDALLQSDLTTWAPASPVALIFANASLHWVADHETLLERLAGHLAPGGTLAVQVPHQNNAPSHRLWLTMAEEMFPGAVDPAAIPGVLLPAEYHRMLSPLGNVTLWETEYYQELTPQGDGHPVRRFTESTFARPVLNVLQPDEQARLIAAYEAVVGSAYPTGANGRVLFPFRRLFFTLTT